MSNKFNIWEGIYESFEEADTFVTGKGFEGDIYSERTFNAAKECLDSLKNGKPIAGFHKQRSNMLPPVVAMMFSKHSYSPLRILDFGGGLGIGYMTLMESIPVHKTNIDYTIVEVPEVCEISKKLYTTGEISYIPKLPSEGSFDLVHSASALQYIEPWKEILKKITNFNPQYILLSDVFAGNVPTFVTLQNYYDSKMKHWFFNLDEYIAALRELGYKLIMKSYVTSKRNGVEDVLPMDNFPEQYRIQQTLHLLLEKK
ncbi:MAG: methyltransferase, TIGR04325 family [Sediminibacterium sp.]